MHFWSRSSSSCLFVVSRLTLDTFLKYSTCVIPTTGLTETVKGKARAHNKEQILPTEHPWRLLEKALPYRRIKKNPSHVLKKGKSRRKWVKLNIRFLINSWTIIISIQLLYTSCSSHHKCRVSELLSSQLRQSLLRQKQWDASDPHHRTTPLPSRSLWVKKAPQQHPPW